ncbi:WD40-repeat-containing domain protein [Mycena capillaripes]|nr:WD40-repeat-containing domain protein [Mycena capillaripes]
MHATHITRVNLVPTRPHNSVAVEGNPLFVNMRVLDNVVPALSLAKAGVTGIGIPGVEPAINGVLELAMMVSTMHSNKEDLSKLEKCLNTLITINTSACGDDLKNRLITLVSKLKVISVDCKSLAEKHRIQRFFKSKEYKGKIQGIKDSISEYIRDFTFYGNISIEKSVEVLTLKVHKVLTKEILANLRCVPARYHSENTPDICMEGTRVDVIKEIVRHLTNAPNPFQRIVMLSGSAGSGKSTIAKTVAATLARDKHILAASFFFSRDYAERKEIKFLAATIALQLADHSADFERLLVKFLDDDKTGILSAEPRLQFQKLIVELLTKIPPCPTPWVICLDALDECGKDRGQVFLRWLSDSIAEIPTHVRFFLTGRPDVPSYLKFDKLHALMHGIILDEMDPTAVERDIRLYVAQSLDGSEWTTREPWKARNHDVEEITRRAGGLFVFAATAVRYILAGLPQDHPQSSVDYLLKGAPLTDLDDLYNRIVNEAISLPATGDLRARDSRDRAMQIVGTILSLFEPLDPDGLAALLDMGVDTIRRTLLPLSAVIHVPDATGSTIRIIHLSFREFMTSTILDRRSDLLCGTGHQQRSIALNLIRILQNELKFNICELPTSYLRNVDMPNIQWRLATYIPCHLRYSCRYWADHLTLTSFNSGISQEAGEFLLAKFLFWLEVLSLLEMVGYAQLALSKFVFWTKDESLVRFARDAKRFIAFFAPAIVQSAPHIYLSALALAPVQSQITTRFRSQFPGLLSVAKWQMKKWPACVAVLEGHTDSVRSLAISPDGQQIVSTSGDGTLRLWDAESGEAVGEPIPADSQAVSFSPDAKHILSASIDEGVQMWDVTTREALGEWMEDFVDIEVLAFSPDCERIVSGLLPLPSYPMWDLEASSTSYQIWDLETRSMVCQLDTGYKIRTPVETYGGTNNNKLLSAAFSSDGNQIIAACNDGQVRIWDVKSREASFDQFRGHTQLAKTIATSGKNAVSRALQSPWEARSVKPVKIVKPVVFEGHIEDVTCIAVSPDGKCIVSGSDDTTVRIWSVENESMVGQPLRGHTKYVSAVTFSPDGKRIISASGDHTLRIWDVEDEAREEKALDQPSEDHTNWVSVALSPNGKYIGCGSVDGTICVWDLESGDPPKKLCKSHTGLVSSLAFSPDGKHIVSGSHDKTVRIWDVKTGKPIAKPFTGHFFPINVVAFSPDSQYIVSAQQDTSLHLQDAGNGKALGWLAAVGSSLTHSNHGIVFSPDGRYITSACIKLDTVQNRVAVHVWDVESRTLLREVCTITSTNITSVAFSPDGKHIVSGSVDNTIRIWDLDSGKALGEPLTGHTDAVTSVGFSPDSKYIVSGSDDTTVRLWDTQTGKELGQPLRGHSGPVHKVLFSADGRDIASTSLDCAVRIWDVDTAFSRSTSAELAHSTGISPSASSFWNICQGWCTLGGRHDVTLNDYGAPPIIPTDLLPYEPYTEDPKWQTSFRFVGDHIIGASFFSSPPSLSISSPLPLAAASIPCVLNVVRTFGSHTGTAPTFAVFVIAGYAIFALLCIVLKVPLMENLNWLSSSPMPNSRLLFPSKNSPLTGLLLGPGVDYTELNYIHRGYLALFDLEPDALSLRAALSSYAHTRLPEPLGPSGMGSWRSGMAVTAEAVAL